MNRGIKSLGLGTAVRYMAVMLMVVMLPRLVVWYCSSSQSSEHGTTFKLGLENISTQFLKQFGANSKAMPRIALITNQSGKDQAGNRNIDVLLHKGADIKTIIIPEQGNTHVDGATSISVIYAPTSQDFLLLDKQLSAVDAVFFDLQDSGVRAFTHLETLLDGMKAASRVKKPFVVLDRPNPLGASMEGVLTQYTTASAGGVAIPVRYGMTIGELAHFLNQQMLAHTVALFVVPMEDYHRQVGRDIPVGTADMAQVLAQQENNGYRLLRLLGEVAPLEVALGADKQFQTIMLPEAVAFSKSKWYELRALLQDFGIESKFYRTKHPHTKEAYAGLQLFVHDVEQTASFKGTLSILEFFVQAGVPLTFSQDFDRVAGNPKVRAVLQGQCSKQELESEMTQGLKMFFKQASRSFLYTPLPRVLVA